ncbi:hypothetical protein BC936DRAFT_140307 [Jimgerdemannia flammicorona]|uniref:Uncharacterized protein n=2 Tax=Jimgerdemannia flammicorona TaxID=994334 RepID=A0A433Q1Y6_9FUNG|nr:hypothetical protein BC936DRAFT_140307 [Jimgerdemannia flammicorona]RUS23694.1 hypothetical protein BC938DRAFT_474760 [Jimgerdemannia flammicorona]
MKEKEDAQSCQVPSATHHTPIATTAEGLFSMPDFIFMTGWNAYQYAKATVTGHISRDMPSKTLPSLITASSHYVCHDGGRDGDLVEAVNVFSFDIEPLAHVERDGHHEIDKQDRKRRPDGGPVRLGN